MKNTKLFQNVLVDWLFPSIGLYFLHANSVIPSHPLWENLEKMDSGRCWPPHDFVCLTWQFAHVQYKSENASAQKTGDAELSRKLSFENFPAVKGLYLITLFVCAFIFGEGWAVHCFSSLWQPSYCWGALECGMGSYLGY